MPGAFLPFVYTTIVFFLSLYAYRFIFAVSFLLSSFRARPLPDGVPFPTAVLTDGGNFPYTTENSYCGIFRRRSLPTVILSDGGGGVWAHRWATKNISFFFYFYL